MQPTLIPAGQVIFSAGEASRAVYVIEDGEVAITVGDAVEVARLYAGDLFGESGVLEGRPRAATATAVTATTLLVTEAEVFLHAFGMDNGRALMLVKLLCRRLRSTNLRAVGAASGDAGANAAVRLLPDSALLSTQFGMGPVEVTQVPFQVGNRFGGETLPIGSNHSLCIPARGEMRLAAPHFEILRRDGRLGVRDLGTTSGTIVNGVAITRRSLSAFVPLRVGENTVIAGLAESPFRFRVRVASG